MAGARAALARSMAARAVAANVEFVGDGEDSDAAVGEGCTARFFLLGDDVTFGKSAMVALRS